VSDAVCDGVIILLIYTPVEPPLPRRVPDCMWKALRRVTAAAQIVGPHEIWRSDFNLEIGYIRSYWDEMASAPPWYDHFRFPPVNVAAECCRLNLAYQDYLANRQLVCRADAEELRSAASEAKMIHSIWRVVQQCTDGTASWVHQRRALHSLKQLIGDEDYHAGNLPPAVPGWRFQEIRR